MERRRLAALFCTILMLNSPISALALSANQPISKEVSIPNLQTPEDKVISNLDELKNSLKEMMTAENFNSIKDKFLADFKLLIDFFANDGEIKGYSLDELSDEAKVKAFKILEEIDSIISKCKESDLYQDAAQDINTIYRKVKKCLMALIVKYHSVLEQALSSDELKNLKKLITDLKDLGIDLLEDFETNAPGIWDDTKKIGSEFLDNANEKIGNEVEAITNWFKK